MIIAVAIWCLTIALGTAGLCGLIYGRLHRFGTHRTAVLNDADLPRTAVILCLRGSDPFLEQCLAQLTNQDYPAYDLWIVLDSPLDPACSVAQHWQAISPRARVRVTFIENISTHTSLKCNALMHGMKQLDETIEAVVLVDADTITYPRWLRNMVSPLMGDDVGCVTGSRWYDPASQCLGSQLRFLYNAYALVPMCLMNAIWPGSLSMRRELFASPDLMTRLSQAPCEDDAILRTLRDSGLRLHNTLDCVMLNREECSAKNCFNFVRRQLLWTRLSNAAWNWVLAGTVTVYAWLCGGLVLLGLAWRYEMTTLVLGLSAFMLGAWAVNLSLLFGLHRFVSLHIERTAGIVPIAISWWTRLQLACSLILLTSFFTAAALSASLLRRINWRGVSYRIQTSQHLEMERYVPYTHEELSSIPNHSL